MAIPQSRRLGRSGAASGGGASTRVAVPVAAAVELEVTKLGGGVSPAVPPMPRAPGSVARAVGSVVGATASPAGAAASPGGAAASPGGAAGAPACPAASPAGAGSESVRSLATRDSDPTLTPSTHQSGLLPVSDIVSPAPQLRSEGQILVQRGAVVPGGWRRRHRGHELAAPGRVGPPSSQSRSPVDDRCASGLGEELEDVAERGVSVLERPHVAAPGDFRVAGSGDRLCDLAAEGRSGHEVVLEPDHQ